MFLPAIEHDFCLNPTVTRSLSPFITLNVHASPFFISKSTTTAISLIHPFYLGEGPKGKFVMIEEKEILSKSPKAEGGGVLMG